MANFTDKEMQVLFTLVRRKVMEVKTLLEETQDDWGLSRKTRNHVCRIIKAELEDLERLETKIAVDDWASSKERDWRTGLPFPDVEESTTDPETELPFPEVEEDTFVGLVPQTKHDWDEWHQELLSQVEEYI